MEFSGKIVVVTGAAGNLGRAVVKAFLNADATVCGMDHKSGRMSDLYPMKGGAGHFFPLDGVDVTNFESIRKSAEEIHQQAGSVDVLVNCLGGFAYGEPVYQMSRETWDRMMAINVDSFLNLTHAFMPDLLEKGAGKVIAVGAGASLIGGAKMSAYSAAKSALLRLVESLAAEVSGTSIRVNGVIPGTIDTPQNRADMPNADPSKWVPPEAVANAILFLASSQADHINGAALPIRG